MAVAILPNNSLINKHNDSTLIYIACLLCKAIEDAEKATDKFSRKRLFKRIIELKNSYTKEALCLS